MKLTVLEAFQAMELFFENYYFRTDSSDMGGLLGDMILLDNSHTADPAAWEKWIECVENVKKDQD